MSDRNIIVIPGVDREFNRIKILFVLLLPIAMALMAISSVNVALPTLEAGLHATDSDIQWVLAGYALALGVSLVPAGRLGDVLGRGSMFIVGLVVFVAASLACGLAPTPLFLNIARLVQGVGAGMFNPQVSGMIQQYFFGPGRAKAFALFGLVISASVVIGPLLAGTLIGLIGPENGWRWAFLINTPLGVVAIVLALVWFPFETERHRRRNKGSVGRVDLDPLGSVLLCVAVLALMWPFMSHEQLWMWGLLAVAPGLFWLWWRWEAYYLVRGRQPLVDLKLFSYKSFANGTLVSGILFLGSASTFVIIAIYMQSALGATALETGLIGTPNAILSAWSSMWAAKHVFTKGRRLIVGALATQIAGYAALVLVIYLISSYQISFWWLSVPLLLNGWAIGVFSSCNQTLSLENVPLDYAGTAGGIKQTAERVATAIGNAMVTGIFFAVQRSHGWTPAFYVGIATISVGMVMTLLVAIRDYRYHRSVR